MTSTSTTPDHSAQPAPATPVDVVIVGGSAAGLSAAVALGRSLRSVVVVDAGRPRNAPADGAHNLLGREGIAPADLLAAGRAEALGYGATIVDGEVTAAVRLDGTDPAFEVGLADGSRYRARRLLLATGLVDELPDVDGIGELWGRDVLHCPYCHGYEVRGRRIGVLGTGPMAMHQVLLFTQLSDQVTLIDQSLPELSADEYARLDALGVPLVRGPVRRLDTAEGRLRAAVLSDGTELELDALTVTPRFVARADLFTALGGELADNPMGTFIPTEMGGRTSVPGVFAAGNAADISAIVGASAAAGVQAGALINADLADADVTHAVAMRVSTATSA
ncbi:NAD(P)/FAD-dependent oxidoreductase [Gordonia desulfuricans]|uniref:NAD(P)/FAD-dependent oxidoreductase n=1 Tax=Gordonia desulfuricans TaxID=89051 RepID=A0A7K3LLY4_9ACTN|nr:NAD(P)/FAD-dependent oxidoreductase [Gordonia desulfuricans]NDK89254.1 NAD(P)/FAD-dependent oxidoreductase [Gordonia desulfuricans]